MHINRVAILGLSKSICAYAIYGFSLLVSETQTYYTGGNTDPLKVHFNVTARLHSTQIICYIVVLKVLNIIAYS